MQKSLHGRKVAMLVANGFDEAVYMAVQKTLQGVGASVTMVSAGQSLVNGWRDGEWGLNFPADAMLSSALAADFDVLVVPGGARAVEKMKTTEHTKRFINGFMSMFKPMMLVNDAASLMEFSGHSAPEGADAEGVVHDKAVMAVHGDTAFAVDVVEGQMVAFLASCFDVAEAA